MPPIKDKMPWLEPGNGTIEQDGASPHTGNDTEKLNRAGREEGWERILVAQSAQSPNLNIKNLGLFAYPKSRDWGKHFGSIHDLFEGVESLLRVRLRNGNEGVKDSNLEAQTDA